MYVNRYLKEKLEELRKWVKEREGGVKMLVGANFIARTGNERGRVREGGKREGEIRKIGR